MAEDLNINIIGNGFDKMHGVDSTYFDFLEHMNKEEDLQSNCIFKEMYDKKYNDTWIDCESYLNDLFNGFIEFRNGQLAADQSSGLDIFINYANRKYGSIKSFHENTNMGVREAKANLGTVINFARKHQNPSQYLIVENDILKVVGSSETFLVEKIESDLLHDYYELRNHLISYLKFKESNFKINQKFEQFIKLKEFDINSVCLNFNYTNTALHYFDKIHHIHGDLINENIVWGYYKCKMENICKEWQALCLNAGNGFYDELYFKLVKKPSSININIFGHSLGDNDKIVYDEIIKMIEECLELKFEDAESLRLSLTLSINYTFYDVEKQMGRDQINKVKNIRKLGPASEYVISERNLNGYNTKYEF